MTALTGQAALPGVGKRTINFIWFELTGRCNLRCVHCYAESGPSADSDPLPTGRWIELLGESKDLGAALVQFIGGEPTLHPDFRILVQEARRNGLSVEVYTNLTTMTSELWNFFENEGVAVATSYYGATASTHELVTLKRGSHRRTLGNLREALARGIQLRVGVVDVFDEQDAAAAIDQLHEIGVSNIRLDHMRQIGRGRSQREESSPIDALCGACVDHRVAIDPSGEVFPCVFSRWMSAGNVRHRELAAVLMGEAFATSQHDLEVAFARRNLSTMCSPDCNPTCGPGCIPSCNPYSNPPRTKS